jgi:hypothetical protein
MKRKFQFLRRRNTDTALVPNCSLPIHFTIPTYEQALQWSRSFDSLLNDKSKYFLPIEFAMPTSIQDQTLQGGRSFDSLLKDTSKYRVHSMYARANVTVEEIFHKLLNCLCRRLGSPLCLVWSVLLIVLVFSVVFLFYFVLCIVYRILPVSLDCLFLIVLLHDGCH